MIGGEATTTGLLGNSGKLRPIHGKYLSNFLHRSIVLLTYTFQRNIRKEAVFYREFSRAWKPEG